MAKIDFSRELGHYVYVYYDTETGEPFYIGKGKGGRAEIHGQGGSHNTAVNDRIAGENYSCDVLAWGLEENVAFQVDAAAIDLIGIDNLLNENRGKGSRSFGRVSLETLKRALSAKNRPIERIDHNIVFVSIRETYERYGNSPGALYNSTRGIWKLALDRVEEYDYIAGTVNGVVLSMYQVGAWLPEQSTRYEYRVFEDYDIEDSGDKRVECVGIEASPEVLDLYIGRSIKLYQNSHFFGPVAGRVVYDRTTGEYGPE